MEKAPSKHINRYRENSNIVYPGRPLIIKGFLFSQKK